MYIIRGKRYRRSKEQWSNVIIYTTYIFEVSGGIVEDFLRVLMNKTFLVYRRDRLRRRMMLAESMITAKKDFGLDPASRVYMLFSVNKMFDNEVPLTVEFYKEIPNWYQLGDEDGDAEAVVIFGKYSTLIAVDGKKYVAYDPTVNGFTAVSPVEQYPFTEDISRRKLSPEEVEEIRKIAEFALVTD